MLPLPTRRNVARGIGLGWLLAALFLLYDILVPFTPDISYARMVTDRAGQPLTAFLSRDERWRFSTDLDDISPMLRQALVYKEDHWFTLHPGINPFAIFRAAVDNSTSGYRTSGASTITMQCARLLRPAPRTWWNKCLEAVHALQLELHHSKDDILRMYCTLAPYGGNVEGVKAASVLYFDKMPRHLSLGEVATLMVIPNRPTTLRLGRANAGIVTARNRWLQRMGSDGLFSAMAIRDATMEPLNAHRIPTPRGAWHLSMRLLQQHPHQPLVRSTIDAGIQQRIEELTANHVRRLYTRGITNASVMVIDNATHEVVGYVGSADPGNVEHAGQVDGVRAVRSPGSTLKPFLYASAFDAGIVTPHTMLHDVPVNYDGYSPENFDRRYHGVVSMEEALGRSLNVPAVSLLASYGIERFLDILGNARLTTISARRRHLGLSVILGGCGVRLDELATAYTAFTHDGMVHPVRWTLDAAPAAQASPSRVMSASAAYMITESLLKIDRPDYPAAFAASSSMPHVAWKTGTSYGRRDAWSIGYNGRYTVGVWVGNFNGQGSADLSGAETATPLLFDVVRAITPAGEPVWHQRPRQLDARLVCSVTGRIPAETCTDLVVDDALPGISKAIPCDHLREMFVSNDGRMSYCVDCMPTRGYRRASFLNLPQAVLAYMRAEHQGIAAPPPHNPACTRIEAGGAITILSPTHNKEYILERDAGSSLLLRCAPLADASMVYWYLDDVFITSAPPTGTTFITPGNGTHEIGVMDDRGRSARCSVTVTRW